MTTVCLESAANSRPNRLDGPVIRRPLGGADEGVPASYDDSWSGRSSGRGPVAELSRHDHAHATEYVATLRAWLEAHGDPAQGGERLGVHKTTVRYRLRQMAEITAWRSTTPKAACHADRPRGHQHRLTIRAVEMRQSAGASLSGSGKPYGGHSHHHGHHGQWSDVEVVMVTGTRTDVTGGRENRELNAS